MIKNAFSNAKQKSLKKFIHQILSKIWTRICLDGSIFLSNLDIANGASLAYVSWVPFTHKFLRLMYMSGTHIFLRSNEGAPMM